MLPDFFRKYTNILSIHIYYIFTIYSYILYRNNNQDLYASMINNHRAFYGGGALSLLCICPLSLVTDISAMVASCFAWWYTSVMHRFPFGAGTPGNLRIQSYGRKFWPLDHDYLENRRSVKCQLEPNISLTRAF